MQTAEKAAEKRGEQRGEKRGMEEGLRKKAIEIARNLLDVLDEETISQKTGLTVEEVRALKTTQSFSDT